MLLGKLCFLFLPFFVSGLHLERRGYRDLVIKVVYMMEIMKAIMITRTPSIVKGNKSLNLVWFK